MIARQGLSSWFVILRKTPDMDAVIKTFNSRSAAVMFIGNRDLEESAKRWKRKKKEWAAAHPDLIKQYAKTARQNLKRRRELGRG